MKNAASNEESPMTRISLADAQLQLPDLIARLHPGEELQITRNDQPIARLIGEAPKPRTARKPGSAVGQLTIVEDDEAHLDDFRDYMP